MCLYLRIERRRIQAKQPGGTRLMSPGLFESSANEVYLKFFDLVVKIHTSRNIKFA